jgi:hypothetical protein
MSRAINHRYRDPLDVIWLSTAEALGMKVTRSDAVFASWDGEAVLTLSSEDCFDADDCLAQMIFHEICHALVAGPAGQAQPDWGLENQDDRHLVQEKAAQRVQAALADPHGLRGFLAVTTDHRAVYEALGDAPLAHCADAAVPLARAGWLRAQDPPWAEALESALRATAELARTTAPFAPADSLWSLA